MTARLTDTPTRRLPPHALMLAAAVMAVSTTILAGPWSGTTFGWYFDDLTELVVAAVASGCAARRAATSADRALRRSWRWMAIACASWALGEAIWSWLELARGQYPFPSIADIGYLGFPVFACAALLAYPTAGSVSGSGKRVLDALMVIGSLALVSWETVLGAVFRGAPDGFLTQVVTLAYPLSDLLVLALVVLTMTKARSDRLSLLLTTIGCAALVVSDSVFAYLTATTGYDGGAVDLGWMAAFVMIALAAVCRERRPSELLHERVTSAATELARPSYLPYVPVAAALATTLGLAMAGQDPSVSQLALAVAIVGLLLSRQYLTLRRNHELSSQLANRETQLVHQAFHDRLTGLANRALFQDRLSHAMALHARDLRPLSVLFLDLDDFKLINDTLGHSAGDDLLARVAERLLGTVRPGDTVARLGGDEFAVLVEDGGDPSRIADKVAGALRLPFWSSGQCCDVSASVGVFELAAGDWTTTADQLLVKADTAMYAAKRSGKDRIAFYLEGMSLPEVEDGKLGRALTKAIRTGEVTLAYQPIVDLLDGSLKGFEALARWKHLGDDISPEVFIPLAERAGLISELTEWVLRAACAQVSEWSADFNDHRISVAVNVPPAQITEPGFVSLARELTATHRLAPGQLVIEITESGAFADLDAARGVIKDLRNLGIRTSLDDFGVGQSSLAQLHNVQLDSVKIDKSFIDTLDSNPRQAQFLRALLRLSKDINLQVIVEGIERPQQLEQLLALGHPLAQGYLFSPPLPASDCLPLLAEFATTATSLVWDLSDGSRRHLAPSG